MSLVAIVAERFGEVGGSPEKFCRLGISALPAGAATASHEQTRLDEWSRRPFGERLGLLGDPMRCRPFVAPVEDGGLIEQDLDFRRAIAEAHGQGASEFEVDERVAVAIHPVAHRTASPVAGQAPSVVAIAELLDGQSVERLGVEIRVLEAGVVGQLQIDLERLASMPGASGVKGQARETIAVRQARCAAVEMVRGAGGSVREKADGPAGKSRLASIRAGSDSSRRRAESVFDDVVAPGWRSAGSSGACSVARARSSSCTTPATSSAVNFEPKSANRRACAASSADIDSSSRVTSHPTMGRSGSRSTSSVARYQDPLACCLTSPSALSPFDELDQKQRDPLAPRYQTRDGCGGDSIGGMEQESTEIRSGPRPSSLPTTRAAAVGSPATPIPAESARTTARPEHKPKAGTSASASAACSSASRAMWLA